MTCKTSKNVIAGALVALVLPASAALAQSAGDGAPQPQPPNVPAPGEPRAQEQLPEAPPEEVLKSPPPLEKKPAEPPGDSKAPLLPNTLPPAKKVEPKVPNT